ncbi:D-alanyl-D-alanine carboxypeptidase family protein [Pseudovibrio ascidiaceicola]|uniref:D-alanyl-D-alanine carboxypeptidase family protein n=1 Tax=Pseudovibrio ascidiaceicola TaxID=285279 RepID=UPI003D368058
MLRLPYLMLAGLLWALTSGAALSAPELVANLKTGVIVHAKQAGQRWPPASLTKVMTAHLAWQAIKKGRLQPRSPVVVSKRAARQPAMKMGYKAGTVLTLQDAISLLLLRSANDLAVAVAETVAGSEQQFVALMNREAKRIGMHNTRFMNPHGLHNANQYSTAADLAILARNILYSHPQSWHTFESRSVKVGKRTYNNINPLLRTYAGAAGMKTGYTCASGYNLMSLAQRGTDQYVAVVLGAHTKKERLKRTTTLLDQAFAKKTGSYKSVDVLATSQPASNIEAQVCGRGIKKAKVTVTPTSKPKREGSVKLAQMVSEPSETDQDLLMRRVYAGRRF